MKRLRAVERTYFTMQRVNYPATGGKFPRWPTLEEAEAVRANGAYGPATDLRLLKIKTRIVDVTPPARKAHA